MMTLKSISISVVFLVTSAACDWFQKEDKIQFQQGFVEANGINIAYESYGDPEDETILLIHGISSQLIDWPLDLVKSLEERGFRVIRYDNRDVGLSSKLDSLGPPDWEAIFPTLGTCDESVLPYSLRDMSEDALGLLDALGIEQAHIVGASMGASIAQILTTHYPERVLSLSTIAGSSGNPELPPGDPEVLEIMGTPPPDTEDLEILAEHQFIIYKALNSPGYPTPDHVLMERAQNHVQRSWYPIGGERHAAAIVSDCDRRQELKEITVPTVIIHGEADPVVNIAAANELEETFPNSKLITIPQMGHDMPKEIIPQIGDGIEMAAKGF